MEDLVPFLVFIVIALVNLVKFILEKGTAGKRPVARPSGTPPQRQPTTLEEFFEELAKKAEPKPAELPDLPKGYERPDYMREMEEFERERAEELEEEKIAETIPEPEPNPETAAVVTHLPDVQSMRQVASLRSAMTAMPMSVIGTSGMRIASAPILRSSGAGKTDYPLKKKADLKKAIIANLIFSPPRAYDRSFDNTIAK